MNLRTRIIRQYIDFDHKPKEKKLQHFSNIFYGHHVLNPSTVRCENCGAFSEHSNKIIRYPSFVLIFAAFTSIEANKVNYPNFTYDLCLDNIYYRLHGKIYCPSESGSHFYTITTVEHNGNRVLFQLDNLEKEAKLLRSAISSRAFQKILCKSDKTAFACYILSSVDEKHPAHDFQIEEIEKMKATLTPTRHGRFGSNKYLKYFT